MASFPRADRCSHVLYSTQSRGRAWEPWRQKTFAQWHGTGNVPAELRKRTEMDAAYEKMLDPIAGSPTTGKSVVGIIFFLWIIFVEQVETKWNNAF